MGRKIAIATTTALLGGLILPAPGNGAVTIGSSLQNAPNQDFNCALNQCTVGLSALEPARQASGGIFSPIDGVIVSWSIRVGTLTEPIRFRVIRPSEPGTFTGAATLAEVTPPISITTSYPARAAVLVGDGIGLDCCDGPSGRFWNDAGAPNGSTFRIWSPVLADGGSPRPPTNTQVPQQYETAIQATIEPDTDKDVFGDETQDKCVGSAGAANGCPSTVTIDKLKQKGETKVKVTVTVPGAGTLKVGSPSDPALASAAAKSLKAVTKTLTATTKQQLKLTLKLTKSAIGKLDAAGKLKLKVKAVYTPVGGPSGSQTKKKKLKA